MSPGASEEMLVITRAPPRPTFSAIVRSSCKTVPAVPTRRMMKFTKMSSRVTRRRSDGVGVIAPASPSGTITGWPPVGAASAGTPVRASLLGLAQRLRHVARLRVAVGPVLRERLADHGDRGQRDRAATGPSNGTGSWMCLKIVAIGVSPRNGTWPVKSSKTTMPSA